MALLSKMSHNPLSESILFRSYCTSIFQIYIDLKFNAIEHFEFTSCNKKFLVLIENVYKITKVLDIKYQPELSCSKQTIKFEVMMAHIL